ncbi:MAG TPA: signal peptidase II [Fervidobacterium sp.]|nr:signal peptidase II [Fervidobacterium sp.]HCL98514.1 signal peptidase II [Fervidobacterium sp.]
MFWLVLTLVLDQITKYIATLYLRGQIKILSGFFIFTYATNTGVAFGLLSGVKEIVIYLTLLIVVVMSIIPTFIEMKKSTQIFFAFILGGALGNLIDRIRFGYVVDFITMIHWPTVFNIADMSIMFGSIGLVIQMLIAESKTKRMEKDSNRREDSGHTSDKQGKWLAARQIRARENTGVDLQNVHTESDKEWGSAGEWNFQEAESQGEVWGYNYLRDAGQTDTTTDRTREHTA